jgi:hypothetical protein
MRDLFRNHYMVYQSPHIYGCTCGAKTSIFPDGEKVLESPKFVNIMSCGHADCCLKNEKCMLCLSGHAKEGKE